MSQTDEQDKTIDLIDLEPSPVQNKNSQHTIAALPTDTCS